MSRELLEEARNLVARSYAPYSGFRVAAVLEDSTGHLHGGVNVENSSLGISMCAERAALFAAVAAGSRSFRRLLVHSPDGAPLPCGACRQALWEFCTGKMRILVADEDGRITEYRLEDLLPEAFELPLADADHQPPP
jgi:cytidine deaminase